jgi:hypothetical protein
VADERNQDAGLARRAGAGREQDALGLAAPRPLHGQLVVAIDLDLRAQLSQVLDKVVGERIVVVEDEDHGELQCIDVEALKALVRTVPDFPKPGILFYDITTLLKGQDRLCAS